jgi:glutathione S-transferase
VDAPREDVFHAWTDPLLFRRWFRPRGTFTQSAELDVRPGGQFRVTLKSAGRVMHAFGEYVEVEPPERLVFTWGWERVPLIRLVDSLVTVEFADRDGGTELVLTHERLPSLRLRAFHRFGWTTCLDKLSGLPADQLGRLLTATRRQG